MAALSLVFRIALLLGPLVNFAGHLRTVDVVTTTGNTVMHVAVGMNGRTQPEVCEVIQFLADHGARLDEMNGAGRTPIAIADNLPVDLAVDLLTRLITERGERPKIPSKR